MVKLALPVSILAAALVGACASQQSAPMRSASGPTMQEMPYRAGAGTIQSVSPVPTFASGGATGQSAGMERLGIKMDNGAMQYVDAPRGEFQTGTRVRLTENRLIEKQ